MENKKISSVLGDCILRCEQIDMVLSDNLPNEDGPVLAVGAALVLVESLRAKLRDLEEKVRMA